MTAVEGRPGDVDMAAIERRLESVLGVRPGRDDAAPEPEPEAPPSVPPGWSARTGPHAAHCWFCRTAIVTEEPSCRRCGVSIRKAVDRDVPDPTTARLPAAGGLPAMAAPAFAAPLAPQAAGLQPIAAPRTVTASPPPAAWPPLAAPPIAAPPAGQQAVAAPAAWPVSEPPLDLPARMLPELPADLSARRVLNDGQARVLGGTGLVLLLLLVLAPLPTLTAAVAVVTVLYLAALAYRSIVFSRSLRRPGVIEVSDEEARAIPDEELPVYTVLVPAFREPTVMAKLIYSLAALEYPRSRLDVKLLLEEDDEETIRAAEAARPSSHIQIVRVPHSMPKTKPKACLVGLSTARGEFVTIFDAEDRPDPLQLRRAVVAFSRVDERVACIQAKLSYHNAEQNLLTRWFTAEYALWFSELLPGLVDDEAPIPLGGTSNHFRRSLLESIGAWDPWNVTEDADLGIRLHRAGYRTRVLDSVTLEEANSDFVNWIKQRSRWYKGYLQTWIVHMRQPRLVWRELGPKGFFGFCLFVLGTPMLAIINPIFWVLTLAWFVAHPPIVEMLFPAWVYYLSLVAFAIGNFVFLYTSLVSAHRQGGSVLTFAALLAPLYWAMMSIAAIKALVQLIVAPSFWEKTTHGLDQLASGRQGAGEAAPDAAG